MSRTVVITGAAGVLGRAVAEACAAERLVLGDLERTALEKAYGGETPSRIVISFAPENAEKVKEIAGDLPFEIIGKVAGTNLSFSVGGEEKISASIAELETAWKFALETQLEIKPATSAE